MRSRRDSAGRPAGSVLQNPPSLIEAGKLRFVVMDAPTTDNINLYLKALQAFNVGYWVRCCEEATYDESAVTDAGILLRNWSFADGEAPPKAVIDQWLDMCSLSERDERAIAVHCVAGLGRAPVLVAIAFIEAGIDPSDAVELIRRKRRGAINKLQLQYVQDYKPTRRKGGSCALM